MTAKYEAVTAANNADADEGDMIGSSSGTVPVDAEESKGPARGGT